MKTARSRLLAFLFLVISFPALQGSLAFFESGGLNGAVFGVADPTFSWDTWFDGSYQYLKNCYLNDSTGCRQDLVRLNNEIDYDLFLKTHAGGVVIGKNGYLFERGYIDEYKGQDYLGHDLILKDLTELKMVQDSLTKLGKTFIFVFAPSKAWFYPDKFPPLFDKIKPANPSNYITFKHLCDSLGINTIDFNAWFIAMKDTSKEMLFSKLGIHWTAYGAPLAADSIIKYIEKSRNISMPEMVWTGLKRSDTAQQSDNDIAKGLNLIRSLEREIYTYPEFHFTQNEKAQKPKTIFVGDSFIWGLTHTGILSQAGTNSEFWYYFNQVWKENLAEGKVETFEMKNYDWKKSLSQSDCVILLVSTPNLQSIDHESFFTKSAYNYFYPTPK